MDDPSILTPTSGVEQITELVRRVPLTLTGDLHVDQLRYRGGAVTKAVLNLVDLDALFVEQRRARVPQVVKPDPANAGPAQQPGEMPVEVAGLDRCPDAAGEDQP
jgi:hypothetical protein